MPRRCSRGEVLFKVSVCVVFRHRKSWTSHASVKPPRHESARLGQSASSSDRSFRFHRRFASIERLGLGDERAGAVYTSRGATVGATPRRMASYPRTASQARRRQNAAAAAGSGLSAVGVGAGAGAGAAAGVNGVKGSSAFGGVAEAPISSEAWEAFIARSRDANFHLGCLVKAYEDCVAIQVCVCVRAVESRLVAAPLPSHHSPTSSSCYAMEAERLEYSPTHQSHTANRARTRRTSARGWTTRSGARSGLATSYNFAI